MIDCPAMRERHAAKGYPFGDRVPKTIRMVQTVTSDLLFLLPNSENVAVKGALYPAWTNSYGAVAAVFPDGNTLGVKPGEFEVVDWHIFETKQTA
jgi:hypothetical protein